MGLLRLKWNEKIARRLYDNLAFRSGTSHKVHPEKPYGERMEHTGQFVCWGMICLTFEGCQGWVDAMFLYLKTLQYINDLGDGTFKVKSDCPKQIEYVFNQFKGENLNKEAEDEERKRTGK